MTTPWDYEPYDSPEWPDDPDAWVWSCDEPAETVDPAMALTEVEL